MGTEMGLGSGVQTGAEKPTSSGEASIQIESERLRLHRLYRLHRRCIILSPILWLERGGEDTVLNLLVPSRSLLVSSGSGWSLQLQTDPFVCMLVATTVEVHTFDVLGQRDR